MPETAFVPPSGASHGPSGERFNTLSGTEMTQQGLRSAGIDDKRRHVLVVELQSRLRRTGWQKATIVNINPFPLNLNMGYIGYFTIPAGTPDNPTVHVIHIPRIDIRDLGDANFIPEAVMPIEIANDFEREYGHTGGVIVYPGEDKPSPAQLAKAKADQIKWFQLIFKEATDSWSRYHLHKTITDNQRLAAKALYAAGEIAGLPEWVTPSRVESGFKTCPQCAEQIRSAAKVCRFCQFKYDDQGPTPPPVSPAPQREHQPQQQQQRRT